MKNFLFLPAIVFFTQLPGISQQIPLPALINKQNEIPKQVIEATRSFRERLLEDPFRPACDVR